MKLIRTKKTSIEYPYHMHLPGAERGLREPFFIGEPEVR